MAGAEQQFDRHREEADQIKRELTLAEQKLATLQAQQVGQLEVDVEK